ncbi:MAG: class II aldolase/adducin family protein, partial [Hyphomicrobiaceae bacterium]|nr:class II aldolase/adducin family protein [Hyphomicrobiaceae bacterium]
MLSRWSDVDARETVDALSALGVSEALALRIYTTRLLGSDPTLVLHGGGNTSLKSEMADLLGETHAVLHVKASGRDMATIDAAGFPAVKLAPLRKLRLRGQLSDEDMVRVQRAYLLDPTAPSPSVEMLLHAFMPHAFIDHTHANAVLSLIDRTNGADIA